MTKMEWAFVLIGGGATTLATVLTIWTVLYGRGVR